MADMNIENFTTPRSNLPNVYTDVTPREIDFVTRFGKNWEALRRIMDIMRPIRKAPGSTLVSYQTTVELADGDVPAGAVIPYSKVTTKQTYKDDIEISKYAHAVPIEDVAKYGAEIAIQKSDEEFQSELQMKVLTDFYTFLKTGTLTSNVSTWQKALAKAKGDVLSKFATMRKTVTEVVGFANLNDAYTYLGEANITVQTAFGVNYVENFLGYRTLFLCPDVDIPQGKVIALPVQNIDLYYIDPSDSEFARLGLRYAVAGQTNLIGFATEGKYDTATGASYAIMGLKLWAEYLDGIAVVTVNANPLDAPTVSPVDGSVTEPWGGRRADSFQSDVSVANGKITGELTFVEGGLAPSGYLSGDGYFIYLKLTDIDASADSLLIGLEPSAGSGLQEAIEDPDKTIVAKVASNEQKFITIIKNTEAGKQTRTEYALELTFVNGNDEDTEGA